MNFVDAYSQAPTYCPCTYLKIQTLVDLLIFSADNKLLSLKSMPLQVKAACTTF
jgi:hypothetical protein